jgi:hypothetical protein
MFATKPKPFMIFIFIISIVSIATILISVAKSSSELAAIDYKTGLDEKGSSEFQFSNGSGHYDFGDSEELMADDDSEEEEKDEASEKLEKAAKKKIEQGGKHSAKEGESKGSSSSSNKSSDVGKLRKPADPIMGKMGNETLK